MPNKRNHERSQTNTVKFNLWTLLKLLSAVAALGVTLVAFNKKYADKNGQIELPADSPKLPEAAECARQLSVKLAEASVAAEEASINIGSPTTYIQTHGRADSTRASANHNEIKTAAEAEQALQDLLESKDPTGSRNKHNPQNERNFFAQIKRFVNDIDFSQRSGVRGSTILSRMIGRGYYTLANEIMDAMDPVEVRRVLNISNSVYGSTPLVTAIRMQFSDGKSAGGIFDKDRNGHFECFQKVLEKGGIDFNARTNDEQSIWHKTGSNALDVALELAKQNPKHIRYAKAIIDYAIKNYGGIPDHARKSAVAIVGVGNERTSDLLTLIVSSPTYSGVSGVPSGRHRYTKP